MVAKRCCISWANDLPKPAVSGSGHDRHGSTDNSGDDTGNHWRSNTLRQPGEDAAQNVRARELEQAANQGHDPCRNDEGPDRLANQAKDPTHHGTCDAAGQEPGQYHPQRTCIAGQDPGVEQSDHEPGGGADSSDHRQYHWLSPDHQGPNGAQHPRHGPDQGDGHGAVEGGGCHGRDGPAYDQWLPALESEREEDLVQSSENGPKEAPGKGPDHGGDRDGGDFTFHGVRST